MSYFVYFKGHNKERWQCAQESERSNLMRTPGVAFTTVLAVNEQVGDSESGQYISDDALYRGPFYVDIDSSSIDTSIKSAQKVAKILKQYAIPPESYQWWVSGKKGFHLEIPMSCFTSLNAVKKLASVYRAVANKLGILKTQAVDDSVYSNGRGRMWRVPGVQRPDTQTYKVPITAQELDKMTPELYARTCSTPRPEKELNGGLCVLASEVFTHCLESWEKELEERSKGLLVDKALLASFGGKLPNCVEQMRSGENLRDLPFNDISLQFAKGVAAFSPAPAADIAVFATNYPTQTSYGTAEKRRIHCRTAYKVASNVPSYEWNCGTARSVLKSNPCAGCPLAELDEEQTPASYSGENAPGPAKPAKPPKTTRRKLGSNLENVIETNVGYTIVKEEKPDLICNFTLNLTKRYIEYIPSLDQEVRVAISGELFIDNKLCGPITLEENGWNKSSLINSLAGLGNAAFYGTDRDVQKLKSALIRDAETTVDTIRRVNSFGVHRRAIGDKYLFTYVEPGWSVDGYGNEDLYTYTGKPTAHPALKHEPEIGPMNIATVTKALKNLLLINQPHKVGQMLGWSMSCFLQEHMLAFRPEFSLVSLHGEPGSGKTTTAALFAALHGVDYLLKASPINLPNSTRFVVWSYIAESTTVPRLFEEYNRSKMPKLYDEYGEMFKSSYNKHSVTRGTISTDKRHGVTPIGANSVQIRLAGPIMICSEQEITTPALVDRTVQTRYSKAEKADPKYTQALEELSPIITSLSAFAKSTYGEVLQLTVETVRVWFEEQESSVPAEIVDRPRRGYKQCFMGLRFFKYIIDKFGLDVGEEFELVRTKTLEFIAQNSKAIATVKRTSEVDIVMNKLNAMAAMTASEVSNVFLARGKAYTIDAEFLYIDPLICHSLYKKYVNSVERSVVVLDSYQGFLGLLADEVYTVDANFEHAGIARGRSCFKLDKAKMMTKGLDISGFE